MSRKTSAVAVLVLCALFRVSVPADAIPKSDVTFDTQSVSGTNGTSFVFFQAHASSGKTTTVPTRRFVSCPVPYYVAWKNIQYLPNATTYDVVIYNCATGQPVDNKQRSGALLWGPGQHTLIAGVQNQNAAGRLVYALNVSLNPATVKAGQTASVNASIADDFVAQAERTLNISVDPNGWRVASWTVDYGDGQGATIAGGGTTVAADHTYATPSSVQPRVTAHVAGTARVADFDPATGDIVLLAAPFTVDVTNSAVGQVIQRPVVAYTPPVVRAAFVSELAAGSPPASRRGFDTIEVPRGTTVFLYVRPIVDREGQLTLDGQAAGSGQTSILSWTLRSGSADGPASQVSRPGAAGGPGDAILQQWNTPDAIGPGGPVPYYLGIEYAVRTAYPDGQTRDYSFSGSVPVTVAYSAISG
jgi:hypothetical protein